MDFINKECLIYKDGKKKALNLFPKSDAFQGNLRIIPVVMAMNGGWEIKISRASTDKFLKLSLTASIS